MSDFNASIQREASKDTKESVPSRILGMLDTH